MKKNKFITKDSFLIMCVGLLSLLLATLKSANVIDWPWWVVTAPMWLLLCITMLACAILGFILVVFGSKDGEFKLPITNHNHKPIVKHPYLAISQEINDIGKSLMTRGDTIQFSEVCDMGECLMDLGKEMQRPLRKK